MDSIVVRLAGDSGDGVQLMGSQFIASTALSGKDFATFPDYPAEIRAPAGTTYGDTHRIQGGGIRRLRGHGRGDQIIQMIVDTPKNLTKRQEELFRELSEIDGKDTRDTLKGFFQKLMG